MFAASPAKHEMATAEASVRKMIFLGRTVVSTVTRATSSAPLSPVRIARLHRPGLNAAASPSSPSDETGEQVAPGSDHVRLGEYALGPRPVGGAEGSAQVAPNREAG